ncbi:13770_t:CDS:2, partial [Racocetra fulgida]
SALEERKTNERNIISEDGKIIENMFWNSLKVEYRIHEKYPNIKKKIDKALKITSKNSKNWIELRKLFEFVMQTVEGNKPAQNDNDRNEAIKELYNLLVDQEINFQKQVKKYFQEQKRKNQDNRLSYMFSRVNQFLDIYYDINDIVSNVDAEIKQKIKMKTDSQFIQDLHSYKFVNTDEITKNRITSRFLDEYQEWRNNVFHPEMQKSKPKYSDRSKEINSRLEGESKKTKEQITDREFLRICEEIEKKHSEGLQGYFIIYHLEEIQPEQLQYTIYNTSLDQNDILSLRQDELHVPNPTIELYHQNNLALFENNKCFIALWNINQNRLEIYYETLRRTSVQLEGKYRKPKTLHPEEQCLIAVNEPKGMFSIYQTKRGV